MHSGPQLVSFDLVAPAILLWAARNNIHSRTQPASNPAAQQPSNPPTHRLQVAISICDLLNLVTGPQPDDDILKRLSCTVFKA